jgi:hypothetical protein
MIPPHLFIFCEYLLVGIPWHQRYTSSVFFHRRSSLKFIALDPHIQ